MSIIYKSGEEYLNKKYKELFFSDIVESIKDRGDTRDEALKKYLKLLEKTHNNVYSSKRENDRNLLKKLYYSKYLIKKENITDNYWNFINKQYINETGQALNEKLKQERFEIIINDQKSSLDVWIDYLSCENTKKYPMWAKYWAFQGMLNIGAYDSKNKSYKRRTKNTVAPFIELNYEVLDKCIEYMIKYIEENEILEKDLENIITTGNFFNLYIVLLTKFKEKIYEKKDLNGVWIKYERGDNYQKLYNSLKGYITGWCTACEYTCKLQIREGSFYIYYTYDLDGEPKIPRIAIRLSSDNKITEIRGIANEQNLESFLEFVLEEKLKEFPASEIYKEKIADQKKLTYIYEKYKNNIHLTKEDLEFLYETKRIIYKFGYKHDPRKEEILESRDVKKDLSYIFGCKENEIALSQKEYKKNPLNYKILIGDLYLDNITNVNDLTLPKYIRGSLSLDGLTSADGLELPRSIYGYLSLNGLTSVNGLKLPHSITEGLCLNNLTNANGLELPYSIGGCLSLNKLTSAKGLTMPHSIGGGISLNGLLDVEGLVLPRIVEGFLYLDSLTSAKGLVLPDIVCDSLSLNGVTTSEGLILPKSVGGSILLHKLKSVKNLVFPEFVGGNLSLLIATDVEGLVLPRSIEGYLSLGNLTSAENLVLPESIGGFLDLDKLECAKGIIFPKSVKGNIYMRNLITSEGLELPKDFDLNKLFCPYHVKQELIGKTKKKIR